MLMERDLDRYQVWRKQFGPVGALDRTLASDNALPQLRFERLVEDLVAVKLFAEAAALAEAGVTRFATGTRLSRMAARARLLQGAPERAEALARRRLANEPMDEETLWILADALREQARNSESATLVATTIVEIDAQEADRAVRCAEWCMSCGRETVALNLVRASIERGQHDPRLFALAGQLEVVLGEFERARSDLLTALDSGIDLNKWFLLQILSMTRRYDDPAHPDFMRFSNALRAPPRDPVARASILFGQAKLFSDVGDFRRASEALRPANQLCRGVRRWSAADWQHFVERRLATGTPQTCVGLPADPGFLPVFIVGLPRSGTSLVAEWLNREPGVRNRGEMGWLPFLAGRMVENADTQTLRQAAGLYRNRAQQDDGPATIYLDKNPINLSHLDLVARLFPQARVIYCRRNLRDTAVSIYAQYFEAEANGFAFSFADIAAYADGVERLMAHWCSRLPLAIQSFDYEQLVGEPETMQQALRSFVGLPERLKKKWPVIPHTAILTASAWQARQPVHSRSIGRWQAFAPHLPEMLAAIPDANARA